VQTSKNVCNVPTSIFLVALKGFPKLDLDIIMRFVKLYKTFLEARLIPLLMESNKGVENRIVGCFPKQDSRPSRTR
jgi:cobalamin biosynthesis Co2+ chelatase CbiK